MEVEEQQYNGEFQLTKHSSIKCPEIPKYPNMTDEVNIVDAYTKNGKKYVNQYQILETLGEGSYGKVKKVQRTYLDQNGNQAKSFYAMKIYSREALQNHRFFGPELDIISGTQVISNQLNIIKTLNHKNIARCYQIIDDFDHDKLYIVMQFCELGQLMNWSQIEQGYVKNNKLMTYLAQSYGTQNLQILTKIIFKQICQGIKYLHDNNISNRDIKVDNILAKREEKGYQIKIIDFSTARYSQNDISHQPAGTPGFRGPEHQFAVDQGYSSKACDIWSIGICLYLFMFGSLPFKGESQLQIDIKSKNDEIIFAQNVEPHLKELINIMTKKQWQKRATIDEVLNSPWLNY